MKPSFKDEIESDFYHYVCLKCREIRQEFSHLRPAKAPIIRRATCPTCRRVTFQLARVWEERRGRWIAPNVDYLEGGTPDALSSALRAFFEKRSEN